MPPQQAVVNGWYTNDLLKTQTKIAGDQKEQTQHITLMLFFLGLGVLGDRVFHSAATFRTAPSGKGVLSHSGSEVSQNVGHTEDVGGD